MSLGTVKLVQHLYLSSALAADYELQYMRMANTALLVVLWEELVTTHSDNFKMQVCQHHTVKYSCCFAYFLQVVHHKLLPMNVQGRRGTVYYRYFWVRSN